MKTIVEKKEKNFVNLNMEVDEKTAINEYNKACKRIAERVNIAGFRKGKAPRNILEKHVGVDSIKREVLDSVLPKMISDAIKENDLDVVSEPMLETYNYNVGEKLTAQVKLEVRPEVELGQYKDLTLDVEEYKAEEDFMEKELGYVQSRFTTTEPVIGRKTCEKDIVIFDFDGYCNGEAIKGGSAKNHMLDIANSNFIPGFAEQLIGKDISEEFTINVTFPENYHDEKLKGQPAEFKIKINEIKEKKVPELNDELAKKVGSYNSLEDLKKDISDYSEKIKIAENDKRMLEVIFNKLLNDVKVDVSDTMIDRESEVILKEMKERVNSQGADFDKMIEREGKDKVMSEIKDEAVRRIKNSLVIHKISQLEKIEVTADDINKKIDKLAQQHNADKSVILNHLFSNQQMMSALGQQAISEKVASFLLDNNNANFIVKDEKKSVKSKNETKEDEN